jgi:hypothetical protein
MCMYIPSVHENLFLHSSPIPSTPEKDNVSQPHPSNPHPLQNDLILFPLLLLPTHLHPPPPNSRGQRLEQLLLSHIRSRETARRQREDEQPEIDGHLRELHEIEQPVSRVEQDVRADGEGDAHGDDERQVLAHALAERRADTEDDGGEDVLVAGEGEEGGVFAVFAIGVVFIENGRLVPGLLADDKPAGELRQDADGDLAKEGDEDFAAD